MATDPNKLSLSRLYSKARELFVPVVEKYNQVNSSYQKVNNPNVRQMYNQLPQRLEPVRRTYNTVNQGLKQASAYRQAVPLQQRVQIARQDMRVNPIKYSLPGQIAQLPNRPAQVFGKAYEGTLEGLSAGLIDIPARPSQNNLERGAYVGGSLLGMLNPSSPLMRGGKLLSKAPLISQTQRPLGQLAGRLIAQGGGRKLAGKALANVSQGIPYTAAYMAGKQALSPLTGQGYTKGDLATDVGFDAAIGAGAGLLGVGAPLAMGLTKSAKNLPNPKVKLKSSKPPTDPLEALKVEAGKRTKKQVKEDIAKYFYGNRADFNQWNIDVSKDSRIGITLKPEFEKGIRGEMVGEGKKISDVIQELKSDIKSTESFANRINEDVSKGLLSQTEGVEAKISILERGQEATRLYNELLELKPYKSKYISPKANENYFDSQILELKKQLQPNIPTQSQLPKVDPPEALKVEAGKYKNADIKQFFDKNYDKLPQKDQRVLDKVIYGMRGDYNGDAYLLPKEQKVIDRLLGGQNVGATQTKKVTSTTNKTNVFPSFNEYYSLTGGYKGVSQGRDVTGDYINGVIDQLNTGGKKNSGYGIPTAENIEDARNIIKTHSLRRDSDLARLENAISNYNQSQLPKSKVKIEANQTVIGKTQISPQTKLETPQPLPNVANASPGLMTQAPPKKQLVQLKKQQGKLPLNDQEKVQPQALDNIIAEGRRSIGSAKQEPGRPVKQVLNDLYTQWVDRYHPLSRASKQAKVTLKVKGAELRPEYDPDYLVRRLTGAGGIADQKFNTELKPIIDEVDQLGIPKLDMDTYLAHKRMAGFGDVDREIIGADPIKSKQITTALEAKYPQISGVADKLYKYQDQGLQELVDAGFISPDAVKTIRSQNPDYAPLYRVMDEMDEYLGLPTRKTMQGKNPVVKIKGSKRQIESPVESIIGNTFRQRAAIEKNRVAQSIIGLNKVADMGFNKVAKSGNDTITVWNNGVKEYWQVGSDIADVAKGVNEEVTNTLLKVIQAPAQLLRQGATGRNPSFMIPNIVRDQLDAGITSKYGYIPFVDYVSGLKSMLKNDAVYRKWQNSGAKIDLGELSGKKSVAKLFDEKKSKKRLTDWLVDSLDVMGKYSEQPTRVGLFKKAYNKTGNELLSAMESRDATVDFARMGSKMKVANSIIPFLNVGVQGFDKLVRATKNNPKKVLLNMGIYGATPAIAVTAYNLQNFPKEYEEIPQYEKDSNFVIVKGRNAEGVVDYFTIPKGNIVPVVANPIQSFMEYLAGVDGKSFSELAVNLVSETLPVLEGGNTPREVLVKTTGSMIPQFAKPIIEDITNKSFFKYDAKKEAQGKESGVIVPNYLKKKEPYQQTYEFTPQMYQKIGAVLNVSPLRVKNLMEGYLAGYAKIPVQITEMMNAVSRGEPISPNDKTVLSRFIKQTYPSSSTQRPVETKDTPGLMDRVTGKADASTTPVSIPQDQETFNELYKKALSNGKGFPMEKTLIENDPTLTEDEKVEKIAKLREKTAQWAETLITMQDKHPEKVFGAELKTYGSNSSYKVPERADWIESQLDKAKTDTEIRDMLDQMWEAGVLTTGKTGTAQELIDRGLNVYAIGNKVGTKSKKAKSGSTKVKKVKIPALKKIAIKSVKYPKVKIVKSKSGNFKAPKVKKIKIRRFAKAKIG